jgi:hypothetical protein
MATVKVVDLIVRAQTLLQDEDSVRWTVTELQYWLNDGYRDVLNLRPDSNTLTGEFVCVAGPRQVLTTTFANATRLVSVIRNTAPTSNKYGVRLVNKSSLDDQRRGWYAETPTVSVEEYMFDPRQPREFLVYPPATSAARLEITYAQIPSPHTLTAQQLTNAATTETIRIDDSFANALLDYVLYRAYSKDAEQQGNAARAVAHFQAFQNSLGVTAQANAASQPGVA